MIQNPPMAQKLNQLALECQLYSETMMHMKPKISKLCVFKKKKVWMMNDVRFRKVINYLERTQQLMDDNDGWGILTNATILRMPGIVRM